MRKLLIVAALGLILLVVVLGCGVVFAGSLAKTAIERGGSYALGVPTTLDSADLGLFSGRFGMQQLVVANPPGFDTPEFMRMQEAEFEVSLGSLSSELVEAPLLRLDGLTLNLEKRNGKTNFGQILERLEELQGEQDPGGTGAPEQEPGGPEGEGKKFVIHEVVISNVIANIDLVPAGGELTKISVKIPEIRLSDVGQDGETMSQIVSELTRVVLAAVVEAGGDVLPAELLGDLKAGLSTWKAQAFDVSQGVITDVKQLGAKLGDSSGVLGEQAGELLESAGEKVDSKLKKLFD